MKIEAEIGVKLTIWVGETVGGCVFKVCLLPEQQVSPLLSPLVSHLVSPLVSPPSFTP